MAMLLCGLIVIILHLVPSALSCNSSEEKPTPPPPPCCPTADSCCNDGAEEYCCELPVRHQDPVGDWWDPTWNQCICSHKDIVSYDKSKIGKPSKKFQKNTRSDIKIQNIASIECIKSIENIESIGSVGSITILQV